MKRPNSAILVLALVSLALGSTLFAQDATPAGPTVELSMIVTDSAKKSIDKVQTEDIHVIEDKVEQKVLSVQRDRRPVDCVIAIDSSGSLRSLRPVTLEAAKVIIMNRRPEDEILVMRFISSDKIQKMVDFTGDERALLTALTQIRTEGGESAVIDALYIAASNAFTDAQKTGKDRRKAVVIITDGEDRNSRFNQDALIKMLRQSDVQVFALGLVADLDNVSGLTRKSPRERAEQLLKTVTSETGGRVFFPSTKTELIDSIAQIIADLHGQFRLTYQSSNGAQKGFRKVEVKLNSANGEKLKAIVRPGYEK
jgi:Ca-activated chloride channel family protein